MSTELTTLSQKLASTLNIGDGLDLIETLKRTAFKCNATEAQLAALLIVANQYGLNPWTKEIYAFPDKHNGIVPVVGIDGWFRIINSHPQLDGIEFEQDELSCTCIIWRKDRSRPVRITEWLNECKREYDHGKTGPWRTHPRRMLRHKALIQCARAAFGYAGITEPDEAERIIQAQKNDKSVIEGEVIESKAIERPVLIDYPQERLESNLSKYRKLIEKKIHTAQSIITMINSRCEYRLTDSQKAQILALDNPLDTTEINDANAIYSTEE